MRKHEIVRQVVIESFLKKLGTVKVPSNSDSGEIALELATEISKIAVAAIEETIDYCLQLKYAVVVKDRSGKNRSKICWFKTRQERDLKADIFEEDFCYDEYGYTIVKWEEEILPQNNCDCAYEQSRPR